MMHFIIYFIMYFMMRFIIKLMMRFIMKFMMKPIINLMDEAHDELLDEVKAAGVKDLFFIIDSCFAGAFENTMQNMQASGLNIVSLMSSKACEVSHEGILGDGGNFRFMVQNLLAARDFTDLNKDDQITLAELVFRVHTEGKNQDAINSIFGKFSGHLNELCPGQAPQAAVCLDKNLPFLHRVITSWNSECPGASW
jgi:hypothetical protein